MVTHMPPHRVTSLRSLLPSFPTLVSRWTDERRETWRALPTSDEWWWWEGVYMTGCNRSWKYDLVNRPASHVHFSFVPYVHASSVSETRRDGWYGESHTTDKVIEVTRSMRVCDSPPVPIASSRSRWTMKGENECDTWGEVGCVHNGSCRLILLAIPTSPSHAVHSPYTPIHIIPRPVSITTTHSLRSVVMMEWRVGMWMVRRVVRDGVAKRPVCRERTGVPSLVSHALCLSPSWRRNETREWPCDWRSFFLWLSLTDFGDARVIKRQSHIPLSLTSLAPGVASLRSIDRKEVSVAWLTDVEGYRPSEWHSEWWRGFPSYPFPRLTLAMEGPIMSVVHTAREYRSFCKAPPQSDAVTYRILHTFLTFIQVCNERRNERIRMKNPVG